MHRIDAPGNLAGLFTEGDPQLGQPPTTVSDDWLNDVQENLAVLIESEAIVLAKGVYTQLRDAVRSAARARQMFRNRLINGEFMIDQRRPNGAHVVTGAVPTFVSDRWILDPNNAAFTITCNRVELDPSTQTSLGFAWSSETRSFLQLSTTSLDQTNPWKLTQRIEDVMTLSGRQTTVSVRMRLQPGAGGGGVATTMNCVPKIRQVPGSSGSPVTTTGPTWVIGTSFALFTWTFVMPAAPDATSGFPFDVNGISYVNHFVELSLEFDAWNDAGANGFGLDITEVQVEDGGSASVYERRPVGFELELCQRYLERSFEHNTRADESPPNYLGASRCQDAGTISQGLCTRFRVSKAKVPTITWISPQSLATGQIYWEGADRAVTGTNHTSLESTGEPTVAASRANSAAYAHWIAEAEL